MELTKSKKEVFGNYIDLERYPEIKTRVNMTLMPSDLGGYWNRCGLTADFGAAFMAFCFPGQGNARNSLSFILNELVENSVKFSNNRENRLNINLIEVDNYIVFEVINSIDTKHYRSFKDYLKEYLLADNMTEKYFELMSDQERLEKKSNLGLMTILNNFNLKLGVQFEQDEEEGAYEVKVQVIIKPTEI